MLNWIKQLFGASSDERGNTSQQTGLTNFADEVKLNGETMYSAEDRGGDNSENIEEIIFTVSCNGVEMDLAFTEELMLVVDNNDKNPSLLLRAPFNMIGTVLLADEKLVVIIEHDHVFECKFRDIEQAEQAHQILSEGVMRTWWWSFVVSFI